MRIRADRKGRGGFTILEVMIVVAILGILVVIAVENFSGMNEKYKVEAETKQLYADLMDARGRAMQRNLWFFVQINSTGYATYEDGPKPDGDTTRNSNDNLVTNVTVRHTIANNLAGGGSFGFNRNGIANDNGTINLVSTAHPDYDCITILPTRIKMGQYLGTFPGGSCLEK